MIADPELHLWLLVEDAVTAGRDAYVGGGDPLARIATVGRAYRAVGAVSDDLVAEMMAAAEFALFVRGLEWLAVVFADLPSPPQDVTRGNLRSVTATSDALVELWEQAVVVRTRSSDFYELQGQVPEAHDWMEIRTNDGLVSVDLDTGTVARRVEVTRRPVAITDLMVTWAFLEAPAALAHEDDPRTPRTVAFEALAVDAGSVIVTGIEQSQLLHAYGIDAAVAWITSSVGLHVVADSHVIDPPVPPAPAPLELTLVDGGEVTTIGLRR